MTVELRHFKKAISNISKSGDNDTLPFDIDTKFIKNNEHNLAKLAFDFFQKNEKKIHDAMTHGKDIQNEHKNIAKDINNTDVYFERLLVPAGLSGFRTSTKIHYFWNIYFNGLSAAIAEKLEDQRSPNTYSYRYQNNDSAEFFKKEFSWRHYKEKTLADSSLNDESYVVQTDISNFYEHIYHHRIENFVNDLFDYSNSTSITSIGTQIDRLLSKFSSGRSFGLPVGSQCSRVLAELFMHTVDSSLSEKGIVWHRYVDDITLIAPNEHDAYKVLAELAKELANLGLSLNKTKTIILSSQHYRNYVQSQLGLNEQGDRRELREIEVYYDPYSDTPEQDYENLRDVVRSLDVESLLNDELNKGQPDTYLISKISQTLDFQEISDVLKLLKVFLSAENLHSFRSSWSTIMRTTAKIRGNEDFASIFNEIDDLLDGIITHSKHLLVAETSILFYLKTLRFKKTNNRAQFLNYLYSHNSSISIKRGCIECWGKWTDRSQFIALRNTWEQLHVEEQKMLWLVAKYFHDDGFFSQKQLAGTLQHKWALGLNVTNETKYIVDNYITWAKDYE